MRTQVAGRMQPPFTETGKTWEKQVGEENAQSVVPTLISGQVCECGVQEPAGMRPGVRRGADPTLSACRGLFLRSPGVSAAREGDEVVSGSRTCSRTQSRGGGKAPWEGTEKEHVGGRVGNQL